VTDWKTMETAPTDRPILGWCKHDSDPYRAGPTSLTTYGAHCEGLAHVEDGPHVLVWGGGFDDVGEYGAIEASCPDWWFRFGSEFEEVAAPVLWAEIEGPRP
jgi:hypothetical protein